jgi:hypothetical protein
MAHQRRQSGRLAVPGITRLVAVTGCQSPPAGLLSLAHPRSGQHSGTAGSRGSHTPPTSSGALPATATREALAAAFSAAYVSFAWTEHQPGLRAVTTAQYAQPVLSPALSILTPGSRHARAELAATHAALLNGPARP